MKLAKTNKTWAGFKLERGTLYGKIKGGEKFVLKFVTREHEKIPAWFDEEEYYDLEDWEYDASYIKVYTKVQNTRTDQYIGDDGFFEDMKLDEYRLPDIIWQ